MNTGGMTETTTALMGTPSTRISETVCMPPLVGCLVAAEQELGPKRVWQQTNSRQAYFLDHFFRTLYQEISRALPELQSIASYDVEVINKFLRDNGFVSNSQASRPQTNLALPVSSKCWWSGSRREPSPTYSRVCTQRLGSKLACRLCNLHTPPTPSPGLRPRAVTRSL